MTLQQLKYIVTVAECKSINKAANKLYITQPSLSCAIKELEAELDIELFLRSNRGIIITAEGEEFLSYARQMIEQHRLIEERFIKKKAKKKFSVSMQHYTFAVHAFIDMAKEFGMDEYEFAVYETKTHEIIENVKSYKSELGIIYLNSFNEKVLKKILKEYALEYIKLFDCGIYVYMWSGNPMAKKDKIRFEDLEDYPCLSFEQGENNSFYYAEEVFSTYNYKRIIKAADRATLLNLMVGLNGYTLCSGILCEELNGDNYIAIPLDTNEKMSIGYIKRKDNSLSLLGEKYLSILHTFEKNVM